MHLDVTLRYSKQVRNNLTKLKRRTKLPHYHTLCRWGLCMSLADDRPARPEAKDSSDDSAFFDLPWARFGQSDSALLAEMVHQRAKQEGVDPTEHNLQKLAESHIARGVRRLAANNNIRSIADLLRFAVETYDGLHDHNQQSRPDSNSQDRIVQTSKTNT